ncbi:MAG: hypothetical protein MI923_26290 [Phycisphaerales bacterium]|nr:hypothetical protein [Phycisphaerales bacterium]
MSNVSASDSILITHRCPKAACQARIRTRAERDGRIETSCPTCHEPTILDIPSDVCTDRMITRCSLCPGREFFIRKDFPQKLGLLLVIVFGLVASVFYYYENIVATFATLGALVLVDAAIYLFVGKVTVCYRCRAEYRGVVYNPDHEGFDLATSEKYD